MKYWLIKSEPNVYSFTQLIKDKKTRWDSIRNYAARNNLRAMSVGDLLLYYHSNIGKCIVGVAQVIKTHYPDPTAHEGDWSCVDIAPVFEFKNEITLEFIKVDTVLKNMQLVKLSRLSVSIVNKEEYDLIVKLGVLQKLS